MSLYGLPMSDFTSELAFALAQSAIAHAQSLQLSISVAIVDAVGNLVSFSRMDECNLIGIGGGTGKQDEECALMALNTINS